MMTKALLGLMALVSVSHADFMLKDGDTIGFLGDSITGTRGYSKLVEHYTLLRYPDRKVRFFNAGEGGDTAQRCLSRLDRDLFSKNPTIVTVAFGINDIGWGTKADAEHKQAYLDGIREIIRRCQEKGIRPVICSPAITAENPDIAEKGYLQTMTDEGMALAKSLGAETIDIQRGMREIQRRVLDSNRGKKPEEEQHLHIKDGVHLNEFGELAMGYALLKGLGAPPEVSAVEIDAANGMVDTTGCRASDLKVTGAGMSFTRLDEGLPLNLGSLWQLQHGWIPFPDGLNGYRLTVKNLPAGEYELMADGRGLGKSDADQLAKGINLSSMTANGWEPGGPWHVQSWVVMRLVEARDKLWEAGEQARRYSLKQPASLAGEIAREDASIIALQRSAAKPRPYLIELHRVTP